MEKKRYLGDGVYVAIEDGMLKLTTEDGIRSTNTIFLEPEVADSLLDYLASISSRWAERIKKVSS